MINRSVIKYLNESMPFLQAPIVGSKKDFPVFRSPFKKTKRALVKLEKDHKTWTDQ